MGTCFRIGLSSFALVAVFCAVIPAQAACPPPPHTIANGQVADATKVMENFEALADCAVSATGTPSAGSLTTFSGLGSIAAGDLVGDVITSGTLTTTLANSGVSAGSYTGANITVDAKGRVTAAANGGGGGIPEASWTTPTVSGFDVTRSGTGSLANFTQSAVSGVILSAPATTTNSNSLIYGVNNITAGTNGWRLTVRMRRITPFSNWGMMGVILRNGTSGSSVTYALGSDVTTGINRNQFSNDTTWNAVSGVVPWYELDIWLRVYDDLTNRHIYLSKDGFDWQEIYTEARTSYITPTQAGVFINPNFGNANNISGKSAVGMKVYSMLLEPVS